MADDGLFELWKFCVHGSFAPEKRQGGRIVTKQNDTLVGLQGGKSGANMGQMLLAQMPPFGEFFRERLRFKDRQRDQRGNHADQNISAKLDSPEGFKIGRASCRERVYISV